MWHSLWQTDPKPVIWFGRKSERKERLSDSKGVRLEEKSWIHVLKDADLQLTFTGRQTQKRSKVSDLPIFGLKHRILRSVRHFSCAPGHKLRNGWQLPGL